MRFFLAVATAVGIIFFSTDSFSFNPSLVKTILIQACGTTTAPAAPSRPAKTVSKRRLTSQLTGKRRHSRKSRSNLNAGNSDSIYSSTIREGKSSRKRFRGRQTDNLEDLLDGAKIKTALISARVIDALGNSIDVDSVTSGIDNQIKIETPNGKTYIDLASIKSISFGERKLNMINTTVELEDGQIVNGSVFHKSIFEFTIGENITVARVDELSHLTLFEE